MTGATGRLGTVGEMWGLLAEAPMHYGAGQSLGVVDLPVAREATTGYPVVFGSGVKGSLREMAEGTDAVEPSEKERGQARVKQLFGEASSAGWLMVSDARLLLLPIRGLERHYWWVTCPALLERWNRDRALLGLPAASHPLPVVPTGHLLNAELAGPVFVEELHFAGELWPDLEGWATDLARLVGHQAAASRLVHQLAVVADDDMRYLVRHALPVTAHNTLNENKTSANLWYEETVPADALLYAMLMLPTDGRKSERIEAFRWLTRLVDNRPYVRFGAHETLGHGWCRIQRWEVPDGD